MEYKGFTYTPTPKTAWDNLSMLEKSEMMKVAVRNGITDLNTIREKYNEYAGGGGIHIKDSKKGTFTAAASRHNMGVQEFASKVLANKDDYSPAMVKKANFARNARHWKHGFGGNLFDTTSQPTQKMQIGLDVQGWPDYTTQQIIAYGEENERRRKAIQDAYLNFVTESNDATAVANGRPQNQHLVDRATRGAKANAAWEKEHPNLTAWGNLAGTVPLVVASVPLGAGIIAGGDALAATTAGQAVTAGLAPLHQAATSATIVGAPALTWADAGLTSTFGAHGISQAMKEGGISPMTALEIALLGRVVKPAVRKTVTVVENYRYPFGRPQVPDEYLTIKPQLKFYNNSTTEVPFFTWGNDNRFKVSPTKESYKEIYSQLSAAKKYKESPEYANLVRKAAQESEKLGIGDFPEDLFTAPNGKSIKLVFENRPKGQLGEYVPEDNVMKLDMLQSEDMEVPYHEGIHWQRVGNPDNIGPNFSKWWKARKSGQSDDVQQKLFENFRNSEEYNRYIKRRNADRYLEYKVDNALYPFADDYLRARGELQAHGLEAGRAIGLKPFLPYPGMKSALNAIDRARGYNPYLKDVKSGGEENVKRFWNILTGQYAPSLIPLGLVGTGYGLTNK